MIAPDLVVESFEFGKFPARKSPYRIKLRTSRDKVRIYNTFSTPKPREAEKGDGYEVEPIKGALYGNWLLDGVKNGKYWVKVWIDDSELPALTYEVKY